MMMVMYPQMAEKVTEHLLENMDCGQSLGAKGSNWNKAEAALNKVVFSMIKQTYLPLYVQRLQS